MGSHGGLAPEQWTEDVDGHSFYFLERHSEWRIELDLQPSGRFVRTVAGADEDRNIQYGQRQLELGDVIAEGATASAGCGTKPVERAQFIVDTVRAHLAREVCTRHFDDLSPIEAVLGAAARLVPGVRDPPALAVTHNRRSRTPSAARDTPTAALPPQTR